MTMTDRDRKLLMIALPLVLVLAYWFVLLSPKREDASKMSNQVTSAQQERDQAVAAASQVAKAKDTFEQDYTDIVELGKAIPPTVDMASLFVQLDHASKGTGIRFEKIVAGDRISATDATQSAQEGGSSSAAPSSGSGSQPASAPGKAVAAAKDAKGQSQQAAQKSDAASGGTPQAGAQTSAPTGLDI